MQLAVGTQYSGKVPVEDKNWVREVPSTPTEGFPGLRVGGNFPCMRERDYPGAYL